MSELKPCPFCGALPQITVDKKLSSLEFNKNYPNNGHGLYLESDWYEVECVCMKLVKSFKTKQDAIDAWNRRANDQTKTHATMP